jgi:hypothetical protein
MDKETLDWSKFFKKKDLGSALEKFDPELLRKAKKATEKVPFLNRLLEKFGLQQLPEHQWERRSGELCVSEDQTIFGFRPFEERPGMCGISITPGEADQITKQRAEVKFEEGQVAEVNVPEGPYQLVLTAPQPWVDGETGDIVFYTAHAIVGSEIDHRQNTVKGKLTAFSRKGKPVGWMVLNKLERQGRLTEACRHIRGIEFPQLKGEDTTTVLSLHSVAGEREEEIPDGVVRANGIVAVTFSEQRINPDQVRGRGLLALRNLLQVNTTPATATVYRGGAGFDRGVTLFQEQEMEAFSSEKSGSSKPIGPTVLLSVQSSGQAEGNIVPLENARLKQLRKPEDSDNLALRALSRWGISEASELLRQIS